MFNLGGGEILVIALIALIVLGPSRLPGAARKAGEVMGDLRRISSGFQNEIRNALEDAEREAAAKDGPAGDGASAETVIPNRLPFPDVPDFDAAISAVSAQADPPAPAKKTAAKKTAAKKTAAKKTAAKKTATKKTATKKTATKKTATKKATG